MDTSVNYSAPPSPPPPLASASSHIRHDASWIRISSTTVKIEEQSDAAPATAASTAPPAPASTSLPPPPTATSPPPPPTRRMYRRLSAQQSYGHAQWSACFRARLPAHRTPWGMCARPSWTTSPSRRASHRRPCRPPRLQWMRRRSRRSRSISPTSSTAGSSTSKC